MRALKMKTKMTIQMMKRLMMNQTKTDADDEA
jgi:hypothetical protein